MRQIKSLDKRYRTKYVTDIRAIQNTLKTKGLNVLFEQQREQCTCPACGGFNCMHKATCDTCTPKEK